MSRLVIVESPTKARTISQFLSKDYIVESSFGHVRDLPQKYFGIDVANDFAPKYAILPKAKERVQNLKAKAAKAEAIILGMDEDREGEAIAWHLSQALGLAKLKVKSQKSKVNVERIVFHEITKRAIEEALKNPRDIDMKLVDAQQGRRILDRIVGYKLSPFLWKKVAPRLSAGRVQSVAVRLIVEREREIEDFKPQEYWSIEALLQSRRQTQTATQTDADNTFLARLIKIGEKTVGKLDIKNKEEAEEIVRGLGSAEWRVASVERKEARRTPPPPFTTSTLQQEASRRLHFSAKQTMMFAQRLYEGIDIDGQATGLISYMRTDSLSLSEEFLGSAASYITTSFGDTYSSGPRHYKTKKPGAQEAHEAIRPTDIARTPESLKDKIDPKLWRLYDLIWRRAVASQMTEAVFDTTTVDVRVVKDVKDVKNVDPKQFEQAKQGTVLYPAKRSNNLNSGTYLFRANGSVMKFDGFLKVWPLKTEEVLLPELVEGETLSCDNIIPAQHFTQPPAPYTEAMLVKVLEEYGIGRPSTYAPILSTVQERGYVEKDEKRYLRPSDVGKQVNDLLVEHFPNIVDLGFTAKMEEDLDDIASGIKQWVPVIREFWEPFNANLTQKYTEVPKIERPVETTEEICDKCGKPMVVRQSRFGKFLACSGFPECKNTKPLPATEIGMKCPKCKDGNVIERRTKKKRLFYGCSRWPACNYASWQKPQHTDQHE